MPYLKLLGGLAWRLLALATFTVLMHGVGLHWWSVFSGLLTFGLLIWFLARLVGHLRGEQLGLDRTAGDETR